MRSSHAIAPILLSAVAAIGCPRSSPKTETTSSSASPLASAAKPTLSSPTPSATPIGPPPVCKVENKKTWTSGANKLTGLTEADLPDGRAAFGLAIGLQPAVLIVGKGGDGTLKKVPLNPGTKIAETIKTSDGTRAVMRVTPVRMDGDHVHAFVDFKDKYKDKRVLVACGPAESNDWWVAFNDIPFFDREEKTPEARVELIKKAGQAGYHEIRDCRTFADLDKNTTWVIGSGLHGTLQAGDKIAWQSTLFVDTGAKSHETHLHKVELKGDPPKMQDYEIPVSARLRDGSFLLGVRSGGGLLVGLLDENRKLKGDLVTYPGFPTLPDLAWDGDDLILTTSMLKGKNAFGIMAMRVPGQRPNLPKSLISVATDAEGSESETDPDFIRDSKGQHWLAHIEGERGKGRLSIAPLDENFHAVGRAYAVTEEGEKASVARLLPMRDGGILLVFLRDTDKSTELITEEVHCTVSK